MCSGNDAVLKIFCVSSGYFPALKDQQIIIIRYIVPSWLLLMFLHNGLNDRQIFLFFVV